MKAVKNPAEVDNTRPCTCQRRRGSDKVHVLAEDKYRQDPDDRDLCVRLSGGKKKRAGELY